MSGRGEDWRTLADADGSGRGAGVRRDPFGAWKEEVLEAVPGPLAGSIRSRSTRSDRCRRWWTGRTWRGRTVRVWAKLAGEKAYYDVPTGAWFRIDWTREGAGRGV